MINLKENKKLIVGLVLGILVLIFGGMYAAGIFDSPQEIVKEIKVENNIVCFMGKNPQSVVETETKDGAMIDYEVVKLEFIKNSNNVRGIYNIIPFNSDSIRGKFSGEIDENASILIDYTYMTNGSEEKSEKEFRIIEKGLNIDGKILRKVSCLDSEFQHNIKIFSTN